MKKVLILMLMAVMAITAFGCASNSSEAPAEEETAPVQEETTEQNAEEQAPAADQQEAAQNQQEQAQNLIGEEKAMKIALKHAGFNANEVQHLHAHLDYDDGRQEYEVHFIKGDMQYEYTINAVTGDIIEHDMESVYDD